jgi:hypothetical protein
VSLKVTITPRPSFNPARLREVFQQKESGMAVALLRQAQVSCGRAKCEVKASLDFRKIDAQAQD